MKTKTIQFIIIAISLLISSLAYADTTDSDLYQINIIVFEHITPQALSSEIWPAIADEPDLQDSIEPQLLPITNSQLKIEKRRFSRIIAKQENYIILLNIAWQQNIPVTRHAKPIHIFENKIDGTITINRDRYFNINTNLILTEPIAYLNSIGSGNYVDITQNNEVKFQMKQIRRMRSNELNYIDHPLFGMLIKINNAKGLSTN